MDSLLLFLFLSLFSFLLLPNTAEGKCYKLQCGAGAGAGTGSPLIQFPFSVKGQHQPQNCSQPGFELLCRDDATLLHFPSYGDMIVKSIYYDTQRLNLADPNNCVHHVFLNLNLSPTPFRYFYALRNYTYLNCSARLSPSFPEIPCLSGSGYHVYTVEPSLDVPLSCNKVKTIAIPFSYNPYISDNSFGLGLTWDLPGCQGCEANPANTGTAQHFPQVPWVGIFVFAMATMISLNMYRWRKMSTDKQKHLQLEVERFLGHYTALETTRNCPSEC